MTVNISDEMSEKLSRLAHETRRSTSYLAAEALSMYVNSELDILDGIKNGQADVKAGRVISQDQAKTEIYSLIETARLNLSR